MITIRDQIKNLLQSYSTDEIARFIYDSMTMSYMKDLVSLSKGLDLSEDKKILSEIKYVLSCIKEDKECDKIKEALVMQTFRRDVT